jgi:hypothetical protein
MPHPDAQLFPSGGAAPIGSDDPIHLLLCPYGSGVIGLGAKEKVESWSGFQLLKQHLHQAGVFSDPAHGLTGGCSTPEVGRTETAALARRQILQIKMLKGLQDWRYGIPEPEALQQVPGGVGECVSPRAL